MKVWLYYRLSKDEDSQLNSLNNQKKIVEEYANSKGYTVVGESYDDNISGMHFDRAGIEKLQEEAEKGSFEAVIVKDLSRLGRHKTLTAMFIDNLKRLGIRVLSATEGIDTFDENDELLIGFKGLINDSYCRDLSRKIRAGYLQKQKSGLVLIPPMGYFKDKNTGQVVIVEEQAKIIRRIFNLYLSGYGIKAIAGILNSEGVKSQGYYQEKVLGKKIGSKNPETAYRFLWENTKVKRILENEFYCGTVVCHQSSTSKIDHVRKKLPPEKQFRHENMVPAIVDRETWEQVQTLMKDKCKRNVRAASGKPFHRYTGLITCIDCGSRFISKKRVWNGVERLEYICGGYHRKGRFENKLKDLEEQLVLRKADQQNILLERIRDREHFDVYTEMLQKCEEDIQRLSNAVESVRNFDMTVRNRREEMRQGLRLIDGVLDENGISNASLRMFIEKIKIGETDGKLNVVFELTGNFRNHLDVYENGEIKDKFFDMGDLDEGINPDQIPYEEFLNYAD